MMALVANTQRDPKKGRSLRPRDFDPFAVPEVLPKVSVDVLKDVFIDRRIPAGLGRY